MRLVASILMALALAPSADAALPRTTQDRPDESVGAQIHFVYAVPSDGVDRGLDTGGAIGASAQIFLSWLAGQTGGQTLRTDTYQGSLDISFVRLPQTDATIRAHVQYVRDEVETELHATGFNDPGKIYDVYWQTGRTDCPDLARSPYLTTARASTIAVRSLVVRRTSPHPSIAVELRVLVDGVVPPSGTTACTGRLGATKVVGTPSFVNGLAACRFGLPAKAAGRRLTGTIEARVGMLSASRTFSVVAR